MPTFKTRQPGEILVLACQGLKGLDAANRLIKPKGLALRWRGNRAALGDQIYLRLETVPCKDDQTLPEWSGEVCWATSPSTGKCTNKSTRFYLSLIPKSEGMDPRNRAVCDGCHPKLSYDHFVKVGAIREVSREEWDAARLGTAVALCQLSKDRFVKSYHKDVTYPEAKKLTASALAFRWVPHEVSPLSKLIAACGGDSCPAPEETQTA